MSEVIFLSIYVAVAVLIVMVDGLYGSLGEEAVSLALFWPVGLAFIVVMSPVIALSALNTKLRNQKTGRTGCSGARL